MNSLRRVIVLCSWSLIVFFGCAGPSDELSTDDADREALARVEVGSHQLWMDGEVGRLDSIMADEFRFIAMNGALETKSDVVGAGQPETDASPRVLEVDSLRLEVEHIEVFSDAALVFGVMHITARAAGRPLPRRMRVLSVYKQGGGAGWMLVGRSITPILRPAGIVPGRSP